MDFINKNECDLISKKTRELARSINKKKDEIIISRLSDLGYSIDLKTEMAKRFKSLTYEIKGIEETWYFNDGSVDGLRIVTFCNTELTSRSDTLSNKFNFSSTIEYY